MTSITSAKAKGDNKKRAVGRYLFLSSALAICPFATVGQSISTDCTLIDGVLPAGCQQPNAGTTVVMPAGENTEQEVYSGGLGEEGFSISIDAVGPDDVPVVLEGNAARVNERRVADRRLENANVEVRVDGLGANPVLAISTSDLRSTYRAGETVQFRVSTNYPAYVDRAEIRVMDAEDPGRIIAVLPAATNGSTAWRMPVDAPRDLLYSARVYDARGRYDETRALGISRTAVPFADPKLDGPVIAAGETEDMTVRRTIPVEGGAITVFSDAVPPNSRVTVMGEEIATDPAGAFIVQRILPVGQRVVRVGVGRNTIDRTVEIPKSEWFYIGTADVTVGHEDGDEYQIGRIAGFAKGRTASGWTITGAVDTGETDLNRMFRDIDAREPINLIRAIRDEDVFVTFGDDSTFVEEAPTSGKIFLKAQKQGSHFLLGDFKTTDERLSLVRSDRTLFGVQGRYQSSNTLTSEGRPRVTVDAYAASPDRLVERDVLEATGGSSYFLRRQSILSGTATVYVQWRDQVSGRVVQQQRLIEGEDFEVNYFQGVVFLKRPLSPFAGETLLTDGTVGRYDVELVAQYEYVPTLTDVDGSSVGGRVETWANDHVRVGLTAQSERTGAADNRLVGGDVLLRYSDQTYASIEVAESEGPGFGSWRSLNGGFDFQNNGTAGVTGQAARAYSVDVRADLQEMTGGRASGEFLAYYDKKEAGFVSADYDIGVTQTAYGSALRYDVSPNVTLSFAYDHFEDTAGKDRDDTRIEIATQHNDQFKTEFLALHTSRFDPAAAASQNGSRTDAALRLTYSPNEDFSAWVFGQTTLSRSGSLVRNDRYGVGAQRRISDRTTIEGEISDGSLGGGGYARLTYEPNAGSQYYVGYRLQPERSIDDAAFTGSDEGTWVMGARSKLSDQVTIRTENTIDRYGDKPTLASTFGVTYTPNDVWVLDGGIIFGEKRDPVTGRLERRGASFGAHYTDGERARAGVSLEYHKETSSTNPMLNRETWGLNAYARYQYTESLRLLSNLDVIISDSQQTSVRDGRYIEGKLGVAYRPVDNDRLNVLLSYTYLEDLPGPDQVNIEGNINGPRQKSHILNLDASYDLNRQWTLGAKYGYRKAEVETTRNSGAFTSNTAQLAILRLDYHVVHNWDITGEVRYMDLKEAGVSETGGLVGVWRHFGNNVKAGIGYQINDVDDDLRYIDGRKEGAFFNIIAKF